MSDVVRHPRPVKRFPRVDPNNPLMDEENLQKILTKIYPKLLWLANKIACPSHIDPEDLVQEAFCKILKNKSHYDSSKSILNTWIINIAKRKFYDVAITEYNRKGGKNPEQNIEEIEALSADKIFQEYEPHSCQVEYDMRYDEIIRRTKKRLNRKLDKQILDILANPPQDLIEQIREENKQKQIAKDLGERVKVPLVFKITVVRLSQYMGIHRPTIVSAKNRINDAIIRALED